MFLSAAGREVAVLDSAVRRGDDHELGAESLVPTESSSTRVRAWSEVSGERVVTAHGDVYDAASSSTRCVPPDAVVHLAEQRSAPRAR